MLGNAYNFRIQNSQVSCIQILQDGLERRGYKEVSFLKEVTEIVGTGKHLLHHNPF